MSVITGDQMTDPVTQNELRELRAMAESCGWLDATDDELVAAAWSDHNEAPIKALMLKAVEHRSE